MTGTRRWKWWHVALLVVGLTLAAGGLFVAAVVVSFIGGVDELFRGDPPREGDPEVVAARQAADRDLVDERALAEPALASVSGGALLGGGRVQPTCRQGQHNWKIDDDYDLACQLTRLAVVAVPDGAAFRVDMGELHERLLASGWEERRAAGGGWGIPRVLEDYWDQRTGFGNGYSMADLPSASYERTVDGTREQLTVDWAVRTSPGHDVTYEEERAELASADGSPATVRELVAGIPPAGYAVVLGDTVEYFRE